MNAYHTSPSIFTLVHNTFINVDGTVSISEANSTATVESIHFIL